MNAQPSSFRRAPWRAFFRTVSIGTGPVGTKLVGTGLVRTGLLSIALLTAGVSACVQTDSKDVITAEHASQSHSAATHLQGAWIVDGAKYFDRALDAAPPKFVQELVHIRKMGYVIDADTIEYWIKTPTDQSVARSHYAIVAQDGERVDIRFVDGDQNDRAKEIFGQAEVLRFTFVDKDHMEFLAVFDEDDDPAGDFRPLIPLYRVDREAFEEQFDPPASDVDEDEVATYLRGARTLD